MMELAVLPQTAGASRHTTPTFHSSGLLSHPSSSPTASFSVHHPHHPHLLKAREMMEVAVLLRRAAEGLGSLPLAAVASSPSMAITEPGSRPRE